MLVIFEATHSSPKFGASIMRVCVGGGIVGTELSVASVNGAQALWRISAFPYRFFRQMERMLDGEIEEGFASRFAGGYAITLERLSHDNTSKEDLVLFTLEQSNGVRAGILLRLRELFLFAAALESFWTC